MSCDQPATGRYVVIYLEEQGFLHICGLMVFTGKHLHAKTIHRQPEYEPSMTFRIVTHDRK